MERRGQVTRVLTNYGQLETGGTEWLERKVQPSLSGTSRVTGDSQARFCEGLGVNSPGLLGQDLATGSENYFWIANYVTM